MRSIVILGAGFAGAHAAKNILKNLPEDYKLILINKNPYVTFKPLLHELATGYATEKIVTEAITSFLHHNNFEFIQGTATKVDLSQQKVFLNGSTIPYDYLLISIGSRPNFFNIPGAEENTYKLETTKDAMRIKSAIASSKNPTVAIIGAGPTGVEVATEIAAYTKQLKKTATITLIDRSPSILSRNKEKFRLYAQKQLKKSNVGLLLSTGIKKISKNSILTDANHIISADIIIWTAGVAPAEIKVTPKIIMPRGYFVVDRYLRLKRYKNVFAVGDCAYAQNSDGSQIPQLAQSAMIEGKFVAKNVLAAINNQPLQKFEFKLKGILLPLRMGYAVADIHNVIFTGFPAWWLNRISYLYSMLSLKHKLYVAVRWKINFFLRRN